MTDGPCSLISLQPRPVLILTWTVVRTLAVLLPMPPVSPLSFSLAFKSVNGRPLAWPVLEHVDGVADAGVEPRIRSRVTPADSNQSPTDSRCLQTGGNPRWFDFPAVAGGGPMAPIKPHERVSTRSRGCIISCGITRQPPSEYPSRGRGWGKEGDSPHRLVG